MSGNYDSTGCATFHKHHDQICDDERCHADIRARRDRQLSTMEGSSDWERGEGTVAERIKRASRRVTVGVSTTTPSADGMSSMTVATTVTWPDFDPLLLAALVDDPTIRGPAREKLQELLVEVRRAVAMYPGSVRDFDHNRLVDIVNVVWKIAMILAKEPA